jgi:hypothetical protein
MARYFCHRKCFHKARLWRPGEILDAKEGEAVPHQFSPEKPAPAQPPAAPAEPRTFHEFNEQQYSKNANRKRQQ